MFGPTGLGMLIWLRDECVCCGGMAADWSLVTESRGGVGCGDLVLKALLDPIPLAEESELTPSSVYWTQLSVPGQCGDDGPRGGPAAHGQLAVSGRSALARRRP